MHEVGDGGGLEHGELRAEDGGRIVASTDPFSERREVERLGGVNWREGGREGGRGGDEEWREEGARKKEGKVR